MRSLVELFSGPATRNYAGGAVALIVLAVVAANLLSRAVSAVDSTVTGSISARTLPTVAPPLAAPPGRTAAEYGLWERVLTALAALR